MKNRTGAFSEKKPWRRFEKSRRAWSQSEKGLALAAGIVWGFVLWSLILWKPVFPVPWGEMMEHGLSALGISSDMAIEERQAEEDVTWDSLFGIRFRASEGAIEFYHESWEKTEETDN